MAVQIHEVRYLFGRLLNLIKMPRKIVSEKEKCKKDGTNTRTSGVIPFIQLGEINPGEFMVFYQSLLPDGEDGKGWLFPKARAVSGKFNPHDPLSDMYETKQKVGVHKLEQMLPTLCEVVGHEKRTNHSLRATAGDYFIRQI